jgi:hypothetical protein
LAYQYQALFDKIGCKLCDHLIRCSATKNMSETKPCKDFTKIEKMEVKISGVIFQNLISN